MLENLKNYHILLGSNSPRRRELLNGLDLSFEVKVLSGLDESYPDTLRGGDIPEYLSRKKASAYRDILEKEDLLITADTVVCLDGQVLGKPTSREEAIEMITKLQGRTHEVFTGVSLTTREFQRSFFVGTTVHFVPLSQEEITYYVERYHPMDKAGSYGVQEWIGYVGVDRMDGCYYNIMGLPVQRLYEELKRIPKL